MAFIGAWLVWRTWKNGGARATMRLIPCMFSAMLPYLAWMLMHYLIAGYLFVPKTYLSHVGGWCYGSFIQALKQWLGCCMIFAFEDLRCILAIAAITSYLVVRFWKRSKYTDADRVALFLIAGMIFSCSIGIAAGNFQMMRRYWLPVVPVYYGAFFLLLRPLGGKAAFIFSIVMIPLQILMWFHPVMPSLGFNTGEKSSLQSPANLRYRDVIACHRDAAGLLMKLGIHARVLTNGWFKEEFEDPEIGYVSSPIASIAFNRTVDLMDQPFDWVCIETSGPWHTDKSLTLQLNRALSRGLLIEMAHITRPWCTVIVAKRPTALSFADFNFTRHGRHHTVFLPAKSEPTCRPLMLCIT
jgi:hypothetical protein